MTAHDSDAHQSVQHDDAVEGFVDLFGREFYRIADFDRMEPFFMTVVGSGDAWLFMSSTGGLTAGRVQPDSALFPYYTDDKVSESAGRTGGLSLLRVQTPASGDSSGSRSPRTTSPAGRGGTSTRISSAARWSSRRSEHDLGLRLRVAWQTGSRFGIVRTCELTNVGEAVSDVEILDGLVNVLPAGVGVNVQNGLSNLLDAYKRSEVDVPSGLGMFWLSSRLTDLAEPSESLHANVAWHVGLGVVDHLLSTSQVARFRRGDSVEAEHDVRGQRGAYLVHTRIRLAPNERRTWSIAGDVEQDAADVVELRDRLARPAELGRMLEADLQTSRAGLERILASADGLQSTGDRLAAAHHQANVLFNVMRGGVPVDGYRIESRDVRQFLQVRSPATAERCAALLAELPAELTIEHLLERARNSGDLDLWRLALEYLPLTFSRRHGDPSRPWNSFQIALRDANGDPRLSFQGNWRDIFQNWEALAWSFPEYLESMVAVFLDATTSDGYNPYRISRDGIDWEVPEPDNPWANIGYWSDHQIIYLLRLMEASARFHPGRLQGLLDVPLFTHADVPYRIASYEQTLLDPCDTVSFDEGRSAVVESRIAEEGADGRLVHGPDGDLLRVTLGEKLLLLLLAKLVNLVPDGGIWMNTQRPEWNDANNALVGRGLSVVTLAQLRRYVEFTTHLITEDTHVTVELADLLASVTQALDGASARSGDGVQRRLEAGVHGRAGNRGQRLPGPGLLGVQWPAHRGHGGAGAGAARTVAVLCGGEPAGERAPGFAVPLLQHPRPLRGPRSHRPAPRDAGGAGRAAVQWPAGAGGIPDASCRPARQRPLPRRPAQLPALSGQGPPRLSRPEPVPGESRRARPARGSAGRGVRPQPRGARCARRPPLRIRDSKCAGRGCCT